MLLGTAVLSAGCAGQAEEEDTGKEEVSIPIILTVDSSTGIKNEEDVLQKIDLPITAPNIPYFFLAQILRLWFHTKQTIGRQQIVFYQTVQIY